MKFSKLISRNFSSELLNFVPKYEPVTNADIKNLKEFVEKSKKILIVTGAGISTESGIPDYRSEVVGLYARSDHRPVLYQEFLKSSAIRQRYWARNYVGWERFSSCQPNSTHLAVRNLELLGKVSCIITQNVDNLHYKAGSQTVIELHGTAFRVNCLDCHKNYNRAAIQNKLKQLNPQMTETSKMIRPDGDVDISPEKIKQFHPPFCDNCGGTLKPDIVFFGDNVPKTRVDTIRELVTKSDSILVLGSSLTVFSGYRIILQAVDEHKPIAIVNIGPTRADKYAELKIPAKCGDILPKIC